jgi:hypothetical protein
MPEQREDEGKEEEHPKKGGEIVLVSHQQAPEVAQPSESVLYLPTLSVAGTSLNGASPLWPLPRSPLLQWYS